MCVRIPILAHYAHTVINVTEPYSSVEVCMPDKRGDKTAVLDTDAAKAMDKTKDADDDED